MSIPPSTISLPSGPPVRGSSATGIKGVFKQYGCQATDEGLWYFCRRLEPSRPPTIYEDLLGRAAKRIDIWDPYINEEDANLLAVVRSPVAIRVLAWRLSDAFKAKAETILGLVGAAILVGKCNALNEWKFHDRYLFIDGDVFMVGSSMEYHRCSITSTSVLRIGEAKACELLRNRFDEFWNDGRIIP